MGFRRASRRFAAKTAAAIGLLLAITATAAVIIRMEFMPADNLSPDKDGQESIVDKALAVRTIEFDDVPLTVVIDEIRSVYGVELDSVPVNAGDYRLTLHYSGNAADLVETINEILDTEISIRE